MGLINNIKQVVFPPSLEKSPAETKKEPMPALPEGFLNRPLFRVIVEREKRMKEKKMSKEEREAYAKKESEKRNMKNQLVREINNNNNNRSASSTSSSSSNNNNNNSNSIESKIIEAQRQNMQRRAQNNSSVFSEAFALAMQQIGTMMPFLKPVLNKFTKNGSGTGPHKIRRGKLPPSLRVKRG